MVVTTDGQQVVGITGDQSHPMSEGYLCGKARTLVASHHDARRLDRVLVGRPPARRAEGLERALDELGARLRSIVDESGPDAVGVYMGTQGYLESGAGGMVGDGPVQRFVDALGTRSFYSSITIDNIAQIAAGIMVTGNRFNPGMVVDHTRARFLLVFGHNPIVSHASWTNPVVRLRRIKARGEIWVVDPRRSEVAALADRHLQIRASTDVFLVAHLVRELLRDGADQAYVRDHCRGVDELRAAVAPHTLDRTAARTGLPAAAITALVDAIRRAGTLAVQSGTGTRMGPQPATTQWLILALSIITGSLDRPGGNIVLGRGLNWGPPSARPRAAGPLTRPELTSWSGLFPCVAMADEIEAGNVRALLCTGGNPVVSFPDARRIKGALRSLDVFAVNDIVPTASTEIATHVLPGTSEFEDVSFIRGLTADGRHFAQVAAAPFAPTGDRRPTWWFLDQLAARMGMDRLGPDPTAGSIHAPGHTDLFDRLLESDDGIHVGERVAFGTLVDHLPDRRWDLAPPELVDQLRRVDEPPSLVLVPRRQPRHMNSYLVDVAGPSGKLDPPELLVHPEDAVRFCVSDGDTVVLSSESGELTVVARATEAIARGAVSLPHGHPGCNVNHLIGDRLGIDALSGMPRLSGTPVTLRPIGRGSASA